MDSEQKLLISNFRNTIEYFYQLYSSLTDPELNYDPSSPLTETNNPALVLSLVFRGVSTTKDILEERLIWVEVDARKNSTLGTIVNIVNERVSFLEREIQNKMTIEGMRRMVGHATTSLDYLFKEANKLN